MNAMQGENGPTMSDQVGDLFAALVKAQAAFPREITHRKVNAGRVQYDYVTLPALMDAVLPSLGEHGLALMQPQRSGAGGKQAEVCTMLVHGSGQWFQSPWTGVAVAKQDAQAWGSAYTYARRYSLVSTLGLAPDKDDDGRGAMPRRDQRPQPVKGPTKEDAARAFATLGIKPDGLSVSDLWAELVERAEVADATARIASLSGVPRDQWSGALHLFAVAVAAAKTIPPAGTH